jgi:hypothetical protein
MAYLRNYYEPDNANEQTRMQQPTKDYQILSNELYKTFVSAPSSDALANLKARAYFRKFMQVFVMLAAKLV